jgi:formylglycine-generating enzyme required for sulfatase activity/tRNA A-37 threonylcarbamoyl transferase component Bud32
LGGGGFGKTYLAEDIDRLNTKCVIKQFAPQIQGIGALEKATELFQQEAKRLEQLGTHPQIPGLWAYFEEHSRLYLVQEFIEGENLLVELKKQGTFGEEKIRGLLLDLLPILEVVHQAQVIHRDIKPENIMRRGSDGKLFLIDFGASKQIQGTVKSGTQIGTWGYAALEQMQDRQVYPATDLYSVGATCFHLLTGIHPWDLYIEVAYIWVQQWQQHLKQSISPQLEAIVDKLLQKEYQQRYQSAGEVLQALIEVPPQLVAPTVLTSPQAVASTPKNTPNVPLINKVLQVLIGVSPQPVAPTVLSTPQPVASTPKNTPNVPLINRLRKEPIEVVTVNRAGKIISREQGQAKYLTEDFGNGLNLVMAEIPGGSFTMGSPKGEERSKDSERPQHQVTIQPFYMGKYPITQAQWQRVANLPQVNRKLKPNPSYFKGGNRPVERVSWYDAVEFCARLASVTQRAYSLPSEAQWEYACRAGTTTPFHFGETLTTDLANYNGEYTYGDGPKGRYREKTTEVGSFGVANAFGLYDMHGNVWEWCLDDWHSNYEGAPIDGSAWLDGNDNLSQREGYTVLRGGSWISNPDYCRSAYRNYSIGAVRDYTDDVIGFRVACGAGGIIQ